VGESGAKGPTAVFYGQYEAAIDAKGRVAFPARLRERVAPDERERFMLTLGPDGCLVLYTLAEWTRIEREVEERSRTSLGTPEAREFERALFSSATDVDIDKQGRILVPEALRRRGALAKDVVFVGVRNRVEIWDRARWQESEDRRAQSFQKLAEQVMR
jgi:MraZ protein